jgi:hypothetical protein
MLTVRSLLLTSLLLAVIALAFTTSGAVASAEQAAEAAVDQVDGEAAVDDFQREEEAPARPSRPRSAKETALRKEKCHSDSDCVLLKVGGSGSGMMRLDELDLEMDSASDLLARVPSWFGPARPIVLVSRGRILHDHAPLIAQGVTLLGTVEVHSAPNQKPTQKKE